MAGAITNTRPIALIATELSMTPRRMSGRPSGRSKAGMIKYVTASSANAVSRGKGGAGTVAAPHRPGSAFIMIEHVRRGRSAGPGLSSVEDHSCAKSRC